MGLFHRSKKTKKTKETKGITRAQKAEKTTKSSVKKKSIVGINSVNLEKQVKNVSSNVIAKEAQEPEKKVPELEKQVENVSSGVAAEGALNQEKPTPKSNLRVRKLGNGEGYAVYNRRFYPHPDKKVSYLGYLVKLGDLNSDVTELTPGATYSLSPIHGPEDVGEKAKNICYDKKGNKFEIDNTNIYTTCFDSTEKRWELYKGSEKVSELVNDKGEYFEDDEDLINRDSKVCSADITEEIKCLVCINSDIIDVEPLDEKIIIEKSSGEIIIKKFNNEIKEEIGKVKSYLAKLLPDVKIKEIGIQNSKESLEVLLEIRRKLLKQIYEKKGKNENLVDEKIDAKLKSINSEEFSDPEKAKDAIIAQIEGIERNVLSLLKLKGETVESGKKDKAAKGSPKEIEKALESFLPDFKKDDMVKFKNSLKSVAKTGNRGWYYNMIGLLNYCFVMCKGKFNSPDKAIMMAILLASCCGLKSVEDVESMCKGLKKFTRENDSKDEKYMIESDKLRKKIKSKLLSIEKPSDLKDVINKNALMKIFGEKSEVTRILYEFQH